jgi:spermidine synthase
VVDCTIAALALVLALTASGTFDRLSMRARWKELGYITHVNSRYGRIVAASVGSEMSIYESGVLAASAPDRLVAEETAHLPMLQHPDPRRVLLLGGGLGGATGEILKHPSVAVLDYVELDPEILRLARTAFGPPMLEGLDDPRVKVHFGDARFFVKRASGEYDVVILGVPDPETAQLNRFYTAECMREIRRLLGDSGVLGLSVTSTENYIAEEQADLLAGLSATVRSAFHSVLLLPGDPCHIIASDSDRFLTRDPDTLIERIRDRSLDVAYVREYYLRDRLSRDRALMLDRAVGDATPRINRDLTPICYYLNLVIWQRQFAGEGSVLAMAPSLLNKDTAYFAAAALLLIFGLPALSARGRARATRRAVYASVFVVGATEICLELAALLAFQSIYGYVYQQLALIIAGFMTGLAAGGWFGVILSRRGAGLGLFAGIQAAIAGVPLALGLALGWIGGLTPDAQLSIAAFFPALVVGSAALAGMQFPVAVTLVSAVAGSSDPAAGRLYGTDLAGAAIGAPLSAVFLLPLLGILGTMRALAVVNLSLVPCLLLPLVLASRRAGRASDRA